MYFFFTLCVTVSTGTNNWSEVTDTDTNCRECTLLISILCMSASHTFSLEILPIHDQYYLESMVLFSGSLQPIFHNNTQSLWIQSCLIWLQTQQQNHKCIRHQSPYYTSLTLFQTNQWHHSNKLQINIATNQIISNLTKSSKIYHC